MTRDTDERSRERPVPVLIAALAVGILLVAAALWIVLPDSAVTVAVLAVVMLGGLSVGLWRILSLRQLNEAPEDRPAQPRD